MFTRQKKNYKVFVYTALIITICGLLTALLWPGSVEPADAPAKTGTDTASQGGDSSEEEKPPKKGDKDVVDENRESYYLVKRQNDSIVVLFSDEDGNLVQLETTDIIYELLNPEDQKAFDAGIKAENREHLSSILQDFES